MAVWIGIPYFRTGHALGMQRPDWRYPSANWLATCERLATFDRRVERALHGAAKPANAREQIELATFATLEKTLYGAATRWFGEAFAAMPELAERPERHHRLIAACAAARAGLGQGQDARLYDVKERGRFREQARVWLQADLDVFSKRVTENEPEAIVTAIEHLSNWHKNPALAGVRDFKGLAALPDVERQTWEKLWSDAGTTLQKARSRFIEQRLEGKIGMKDGRAHTYKMSAGTTYVIDLDSDQFDPMLAVADADGKKLAENDDRADGDLNSRIVFTSKQDGSYRLIVSAFNPQSAGEYVLTVRQFKR